MMKIFSSFTPEVVSIVTHGGVGVIPTDTIYGLVASLHRREAIERIYQLKSRDAQKRVGTTLISDITQLKDIVQTDEPVTSLDVWPGPVSVVFPVTQKYLYAHKGNGTLAFRIPAPIELRSFVSEVGPLATTSANISGNGHSETLQEAIDTFGDSVDFYVDGGDLHGIPPSKIVRFHENGELEVIREGVNGK